MPSTPEQAFPSGIVKDRKPGKKQPGLGHRFDSELVCKNCNYSWRLQQADPVPCVVDSVQHADGVEFEAASRRKS